MVKAAKSVRKILINTASTNQGGQKPEPNIIQNGSQTPSSVVTDEHDKQSTESSPVLSPSRDSSQIDRVLKKLGSISSREIRDFRKSLEHSQNEVSDIRNKICQIENNHQKMSAQVADTEFLRQENILLKSRLERLEMYSRRDNLIITGLAESEDEDTQNVVQTFFQTLLKEAYKPVPLVRCHRLGVKARENRGNKGRPFIVRFANSFDRERIWSKRRELKGSDVCLNEDFPATVEANRKRLYPILKQARSQNIKATLADDNLIVEGKMYTVDDLRSLPENLRPNNTAVRTTKKLVLFFGRDAVFSNFHPSRITVDSTYYNCVEQAFQHRKALDADDTEAARKIMSTDNPVIQKHTGDRLKSKQEHWKMKRGLATMQKAVLAKFTQHQTLREGRIARNTGEEPGRMQCERCVLVLWTEVE